jgi:hypothetical protein
MSANMSRRPWSSLLLEVCARSGSAAIEVAAEPIPAQVGLFDGTGAGLAFLDG